jgi:hypothetical protein
MTKARLDPDGTAKPKTRIVGHPRVGDAIAPWLMPRNPEYEAEDGTRTSLDHPSPRWNYASGGWDWVVVPYGTRLTGNPNNPLECEPEACTD